MTTMPSERTYHIKTTDRCFRFKPDAFCAHAPTNRGIYELVTFDENKNPVILYVGAAFEKGILECLEAHAAGTLDPSATTLFAKYPNLYFDYLTEMDAKTKEEAQDVWWWLVQKHRPPYNNLEETKHSSRYHAINVIEG
jgi:hypothetical protein